MGLCGVVVIYPETSTNAATKAQRHAIAMSIVDAMADLQLLDRSLFDDLEPDDEPTFCTGEHLEEDVPEGVAWSHYALDPECLKPAIGKLVYCETAEVWWEEKDPEKKQLLAVPNMDITVLSRPFLFHDGCSGDRVCESNILIEFSFLDAGLSEEIHVIRDEEHPLFKKLEVILGSPIGWGLITG